MNYKKYYETINIILDVMLTFKYCLNNSINNNYFFKELNIDVFHRVYTFITELKYGTTAINIFLNFIT